MKKNFVKIYGNKNELRIFKISSNRQVFKSNYQGKFKKFLPFE